MIARTKSLVFRLELFGLSTFILNGLQFHGGLRMLKALPQMKFVVSRN